MDNSAAMEQIARYWGMSGGAVAAACSASEAPSWEEQAFARDSAAVWPPRSYTCNFCRREFRSAQALGGHMNVHRRDRARLRAGDDVQEDQQAQREQYGMDRVISNPTTAAAPITTATTAPPSYLSAIIRESRNSKVLMPISMALVAREQVIHIDDNTDHGGGAEESAWRMKKRRRVDQLLPPVALPIFLRRSVAASAAVLDLDLGAKKVQEVQEFGLDHAKVPELTASPSSSSTLVDQQEVDLELRLGTS